MYTKNIILPQCADTWGRKTGSKNKGCDTSRHQRSAFFLCYYHCVPTLIDQFISFCDTCQVKFVSAWKKYKLPCKGRKCKKKYA